MIIFLLYICATLGQFVKHLVMKISENMTKPWEDFNCLVFNFQQDNDLCYFQLDKIIRVSITT